MNLTLENLKGAISALGRGLPPESREALDALAATPEVAAVLQREDEALQARRRQMVADLEGMPRRMKAQLDQCAKNNAVALKAVRDAESALVAARERASLAQMALVGVDHALNSGLARLEAELDATADSRLRRLIDHCNVLLQCTRDVSWQISWTEGRTLMGDPVTRFSTNQSQVIAARSEIVRVQNKAAALMRRPMLRHLVTQELKSLLLDLDAAVACFDLSLIRLGDLGDLVVDDFKSTRELAERATAASRRAVDSDEQQPAD